MESMNAQVQSLLLEEVDIHVLVVPIYSWRKDLRFAYSAACIEAVSAGFIRVFGDTPLCELRRFISWQLETDILPQDFVFLRNLGRCLTLVTSKQEIYLPAKIFSSPFNPSSEMFIIDSQCLASDYSTRGYTSTAWRQKEVHQGGLLTSSQCPQVSTSIVSSTDAPYSMTYTNLPTALTSYATTGSGNSNHSNPIKAPVNNSFNGIVTSITQAAIELPQAKAASGTNTHSNGYNRGSTLSTIAGVAQQVDYALASHNASLHINPTMQTTGLNNREELQSSKVPYTCAPPLGLENTMFNQQDAYAVSTGANNKTEHTPIPTHPQVLAVTTQLRESLYSPKAPPYTPLGLKPGAPSTSPHPATPGYIATAAVSPYQANANIGQGVPNYCGENSSTLAPCPSINTGQQLKPESNNYYNNTGCYPSNVQHEADSNTKSSDVMAGCDTGTHTRQEGDCTMPPHINISLHPSDPEDTRINGTMEMTYGINSPCNSSEYTHTNSLQQYNVPCTTEQLQSNSPINKLSSSSLVSQSPQITNNTNTYSESNILNAKNAEPNLLLNKSKASNEGKDKIYKDEDNILSIIGQQRKKKHKTQKVKHLASIDEEGIDSGTNIDGGVSIDGERSIEEEGDNEYDTDEENLYEKSDGNDTDLESPEKDGECNTEELSSNSQKSMVKGKKKRTKSKRNHRKTVASKISKTTINNAPVSRKGKLSAPEKNNDKASTNYDESEQDDTEDSDQAYYDNDDNVIDNDGKRVYLSDKDELNSSEETEKIQTKQTHSRRKLANELENAGLKVSKKLQKSKTGHDGMKENQTQLNSDRKNATKIQPDQQLTQDRIVNTSKSGNANRSVLDGTEIKNEAQGVRSDTQDISNRSINAGYKQKDHKYWQVQSRAVEKDKDEWRRKYFLESQVTIQLQSKIQSTKKQIRFLTSLTGAYQNQDDVSLREGPSELANLKIQCIRLQRDIGVLKEYLKLSQTRLSIEKKIRQSASLERKILKQELLNKKITYYKSKFEPKWAQASYYK